MPEIVEQLQAAGIVEDVSAAAMFYQG